MKYLGSIMFGLILLASSPAYALSLGGDGTIDINANVSANAGATTSGEASTNTDSNGGSVVLITRSDINAGNGMQAHATTSSSARSGDVLSAYAASIIQTDANADNAQLSDTAVSLSYKEPAELFGFIPIFVQATATVNNNGDATVQYPWYSIFTTSDSAAVRSSVQAATAGTVSANAGSSFSGATQAQLLGEIHNAMKAHLQEGLAAGVQANSSAQ